MGNIKYTLGTGEVIEIDLLDALDIDFTTPKGKAAYQEIIYFKDNVKKWDNTDLAETEDMLKFFDTPKIKNVSLEEFEEDIYKESLKDQDLL